MGFNFCEASIIYVELGHFDAVNAKVTKIDILYRRFPAFFLALKYLDKSESYFGAF
jgi:hypothetical protein